jgi:YVTN family beta-propeller protein
MSSNPERLKLVTFFIIMFVIYQLSVATTIFAEASPVSEIKVGNGTSDPYTFVYNPTNKMMYVSTGDHVAVINSSNNVVGNIPVIPPDTIHSPINHIIYNPANNKLYATHGSVISIIDPSTNNVVGNITLPKGNIFAGEPIAYNPANNLIYATNLNTDKVSIIDPSTNQVIASIMVKNPSVMAYNPANKEIYVLTDESICSEGVISIIDPSTKKVVGKISNLSGNNFLPIHVNEMIYVPINNMMYLSGREIQSPEIANCFFNSFLEEGADIISVINSSKNKVVETIEVNAAGALVYDSINNKVYIHSFVPGLGSVISIIDPSTNNVIDNIPLPKGKIFAGSAIAYNPANNMIYVGGANQTVYTIKASNGT